MKRLGVFLLPPGWDASPSQGSPPPPSSIKFAGIHLHTWVKRGTVRVKCLAQEHNTMSPARGHIRARTRAARSGVERTNNEASAPPTKSPFKNEIVTLLTSKRASNLTSWTVRWNNTQTTRWSDTCTNVTSLPKYGVLLTPKYGQKRVPDNEMRFFFCTHARLYDLPTPRYILGKNVCRRYLHHHPWLHFCWTRT